VKAVILAAGRGKRLRPLTDTTPKPLISIGGKPILEWILRGLRKAGIQEVAVVTGHLNEQLEQHFGCGTQLDMRISYFSQTVQDGTARAVIPTEGFIGSDPFFLGYGDVFVPLNNFTGMISVYNKKPAQSLLGVWEVDDPSFGGAVKVSDGFLRDIVEKPEPGTAPSNFINAGLMLLRPDILEHIHKIKPSARGEYELTDALVSFARSFPVKIYPLRGYWSDIGTHEKLKQTDRWIRLFSSENQN